MALEPLAARKEGRRRTASFLTVTCVPPGRSLGVVRLPDNEARLSSGEAHARNVKFRLFVNHVLSRWTNKRLRTPSAHFRGQRLGLHKPSHYGEPVPGTPVVVPRDGW